jgi:hypothetical protein
VVSKQTSDARNSMESFNDHFKVDIAQYLRLVVDGQDDLIHSNRFQGFDLHHELQQSIRPLNI